MGYQYENEHDPIVLYIYLRLLLGHLTCLTSMALENQMRNTGFTQYLIKRISNISTQTNQIIVEHNLFSATRIKNYPKT
jgi:hypothetical protein